ncbi:MAG: DUF1684 domain-containing protein [Holophagaceae bacterium]
MPALPIPVPMIQSGRMPDDVRAWRTEQDAMMRGERSPLAAERIVALEAARITIGSGAEVRVRLEGAGLPALAGEFVVQDGKVILKATDAALTVNGAFVAERALAPTDRLAFGPYRLQLRRPGGVPTLRVSNLARPEMKGFHGLKYFPYDGRFRVAATFRPSTEAKEVTVEATRGGPQTLRLAGLLTFTLLGKVRALEAYVDGDEPDSLFVLFRDRTSGKETYPVGRYLYVPRGQDGKTTIDFNKAHNPLCAYGPLFFCPIPPKQNHLDVRIPVGEKVYASH